MSLFVIKLIFVRGWCPGACSGTVACWPGIAVPPGSAHYPTNLQQLINTQCSYIYHCLVRMWFCVVTISVIAPAMSFFSYFPSHILLSGMVEIFAHFFPHMLIVEYEYRIFIEHHNSLQYHNSQFTQII